MAGVLQWDARPGSALPCLHVASATKTADMTAIATRPAQTGPMVASHESSTAGPSRVERSVSEANAPKAHDAGMNGPRNSSMASQRRGIAPESTTCSIVAMTSTGSDASRFGSNVDRSRPSMHEQKDSIAMMRMTSPTLHHVKYQLTGH